jgi:hypothetical protein
LLTKIRGSVQLLTNIPNIAQIMTRKRIRIDIEDAEGANFNLNLSGNITREKVLKAFEFLDLMNIEDVHNSPQIDSVGAKIWNIVDKFFPMGKFTSSAILEKYEDEYNEPIKLSIISTYLSRFTEKGRIERARTGREWTYQTIKITQKHHS